MSKTHWNTIVDSKYLSGEEICGTKPILTIKELKKEEVVGDGGRKENCGVLHWYENTKPMVVNLTNIKRIARLFGSPYKEDWQGKQIQITTEKVKAFGKLWDAIRICEELPKPIQSAYNPAEPEILFCGDCGEVIEDCDNYTALKIARSTLKTYGVQLCMNCGNKRKAEESEESNDEQ